VPGPSIDPRSAIDPTAEIAEECYVGPFAVVEANVSIGRGCRIHAHAVVGSGCRIAADVTVHAHATLYPNTTIGERSIVHSGAVIGCDGFGYQLRDGRHEKIPQIGNVVIGADVEIGANSTVDRGTFGSTRVGDGTKIDNQVMIAHNCQIGRHNVFAGQVGIAGSSSTGDYVTIAGQVGIADHVHVGEQATLGADAGVYTDIPAGSRFVGTPARPLQEAKRLHLALERVPEMRKELLEVRRLLGLGKPSGDGTMTPPDERREAG
jgi:UDP-3-O-[3-hydroxymyristoyl] glucosamine N-acyltransferase